jgi:quinol monooxygenase YgiN
MKITKKVVFIAHDDKIEELKNLLITMIDASKVEVGCELYNVYQIKEKPNTFVVVETWENQEALKGHQNSAHYKYYKANFEPFAKDKYSDELEILG